MHSIRAPQSESLRLKTLNRELLLLTLIPKDLTSSNTLSLRFEQSNLTVNVSIKYRYKSTTNTSYLTRKTYLQISSFLPCSNIVPTQVDKNAR